MKIRVVGMSPWAGRGHARRASRRSDVDLVLVNDINPKAVAKMVGGKIVADDGSRCDFTFVATPTQTHWDVARRYIDRGEAVYVEKPLTLNISELDAFLAAEKAGAWICVGQNLRFSPGGMAAKTATVGSRPIALQIAKWRGREPSYYKNGKGGFAFDGGVLAQQAQHCIDLACWLFGTPPLLVSAFGTTLKHKIECEDTAAVLLNFGHGFAMVGGTTAGSLAMEDTTLSLTTESGLVRSNGFVLDHVQDYCGAGDLPAPLPDLAHIALSAFQTGDRSPVTVASVENGVRALHAAYASMAANGQPMPLTAQHPLLGQPLQEAA